MAGGKASVKQHREQQPEGGREISAGGAASYMNPDEGEEVVTNAQDRQGDRLGAVAGSADGVQRSGADEAAAQSGSAVSDAVMGSVVLDRSRSAGAASDTAADAEPRPLDATSQVGAALTRAAGAASGLVASAVGQDSAEGASGERQGSTLPARGDERAASGAGSEVEPAAGASQLGADRRELLPTDAVSAAGGIGTTAGRDGAAVAGDAGLDGRASSERGADRRRYGDDTAAQAATAGSMAGRGSAEATDRAAGVQATMNAVGTLFSGIRAPHTWPSAEFLLVTGTPLTRHSYKLSVAVSEILLQLSLILIGIICAGVEAAQRNPLLGFDPTAESSAAKGSLAGGDSVLSALNDGLALDAAAKGSVGHRDGMVRGSSSSMGADTTDPERAAGRGSAEGQLSGLRSTGAAQQSGAGASSETAVAATDSHIGAPFPCSTSSWPDVQPDADLKP